MAIRGRGNVFEPTAEQLATVSSMAQNGTNIGEVAAYLGVTRPTAKKVCDKYGVSFFTFHVRRGAGRKPTTSQDVLAMVSAGHDATTISKQLGISRQRVNQLLSPEKHKARHLVHMALKRSWIRRSDTCDECGTQGFMEAHHDDYNFPLEIRWLCTPCHIKADKDMGTRKGRPVKVFSKPKKPELPPRVCVVCKEIITAKGRKRFCSDRCKNHIRNYPNAEEFRRTCATCGTEFYRRETMSRSKQLNHPRQRWFCGQACYRAFYVQAVQ